VTSVGAVCTDNLHFLARVVSADGHPIVLEEFEVGERTAEIKPLSHPFVERVIGTMRREFLGWVLFWNARDLERKLCRQYMASM